MVRPQLSPNLAGLEPSATVAINERSNALIQEGRDVVKFGLGQSPFPVPEVVVRALQEHAAEKDYLAIAGLPALRAAVAAHHEQRNGLKRDPRDVMIGPGSKELMFLLQLVYPGLLNIFVPSWVSYAPQARLLGRAVRWVAPLEFEQVCAEDPEQSRLLILNDPNNPSGCSHTDDELRALADVARRYHVLVLSDEIYGELHHRAAHRSIAEFYPEGTIVSSGLSKWCGAGGWRLGTFSFPAELRWLMGAMVTAASETFTSTSAPIQYAAVRAFRGGPTIDRYLESSRRVLRAIAAYLVQSLRAAGIEVQEPDGAFYLLADFSAHAERLRARGVTDAAALAARLLDEEGVALLPGSDFGFDPQQLVVRLAYVDFDGREALRAADRLGAGEALDDGFVRRVCPRVVAGMERIARFVAQTAGTG